MNGELFNLLDNFVDLEAEDKFTSQLSVYPQLESLLTSSFCKPFLEPLDGYFLMKIFPDYFGQYGLPQGPDCIKTVIQQRATCLDRVVEQLNKLFDGYIHYFSQFPKESHFQPYSGEEITILAKHLKKKLGEISRSQQQVVFIILNETSLSLQSSPPQSTLIGRGMSRLGSHWSRASL